MARGLRVVAAGLITLLLLGVPGAAGAGALRRHAPQAMDPVVAAVAAAGDPTTTLGEFLRDPHVDLSYEVVYYDVTGSTWDELAADMTASGPELPDGTHAWAVVEGSGWVLTRSLLGQGNRCTLDDYSISLPLTMRLPRWAGVDEAPAELAARWERFSSDTFQHEQEHVWIYAFHAFALARRLESVPANRTCDGLDSTVLATFDAFVVAADQRQTEYDDWTNFGNRPGSWIGAVVPPPVEGGGGDE